mmetsp:Transcript_35166/g.76997  ORF Transcript_35166/g.76997 Transcript_35166/m.76997 type:complete len:254 (+) Transcript_35166:238-999(+)
MATPQSVSDPGGSCSSSEAAGTPNGASPTSNSANDDADVERPTRPPPSASPSFAPSQLPLRFISKVIPGFGRGSKDLGIPTANLSKDDARCTTSVDSLLTGIYWGYARIGEADGNGTGTSSVSNGGLGHTYVTAVSIGYNPTYGNEEKTIEPHLIAPKDHPRRHSSSCGETLFQDFYGETIRLSVVGYLRPELPFEGLEKLTIAIKNDIVNAEKLGNVTTGGASGSGSGRDDGVIAAGEKAWVESNAESVQLV